MNKIHVKPINDAPRYGSHYEKPVKIEVGIITKDLGGIAWVRDTLRHDKAVIIKAKPISQYWQDIFRNLFRKW